jgi:hypothetical protein
MEHGCFGVCAEAAVLRRDELRRPLVRSRSGAPSWGTGRWL